MLMSKSNIAELEKVIGSEVDQFIYRVPKKNHDAVMRLNKQFADIMRGHGTSHSFFQLNNTEAPMEDLTNIAKTVSANQDEEVWLELIFYKDRKHRDDVRAKIQNDESCGSFFRQFMDLITPGTNCIIGEFSYIKM
jgi:uncharacterized protein YbaA (DUF1428 family)